MTDGIFGGARFLVTYGRRREGQGNAVTLDRARNDLKVKDRGGWRTSGKRACRVGYTGSIVEFVGGRQGKAILRLLIKSAGGKALQESGGQRSSVRKFWVVCVSILGIVEVGLAVDARGRTP